MEILTVFAIYVIITLIVGLLFFNNSQTETDRKWFFKRETDIAAKKNMLYFGRYLAGHPTLNESFDKTRIQVENQSIQIYEVTSVPEKITLKAEIPTDKIKDIALSYTNSVRNVITVPRLLFAGWLAFGAKKKEFYEMAYLVIKWNDGKYDHDTTFEFVGIGAIQHANTCKNELIKICN